MALEKWDFPDPVAAGDSLFYSFSVTNLGPGVASNIVLTDVLPANVVILNLYEAEDVACTASAGNVLRCEFDDLASGFDSDAEVEVCATEPGILTNNATIGSDTVDPNPANNTDTETTTVIPETPEPCLEPDPGPDPGPGPDPDGPPPGEEIPAVVSPEIVYAPSLDADQTTDQDSGDVDQQMEGSPGGSQDANTGNFAVPNQDISW